MLKALEEVGVSFLATDRYDWDTTKPWEDTLSLGEQQRIGLARLLFHKPAFAVLDECTDAVSADAEKALFESLYASKITCKCNCACTDGVRSFLLARRCHPGTHPIPRPAKDARHAYHAPTDAA